MRPMNGDKFIDDLFKYLNGIIDSGAEVHIVDHSDPNHVKEHVFNADEDVEVDVSVDADTEVEIDIDDELPFDEICEEEHNECDSCPHFEECYADEIADCEDSEPLMWGVPDIERVVFNDPATIVFWEDGTKTVVKCAKDQTFERYAGFIAACAKKMFGSTSRAKAIMEECAYDQPPKVKKERVVAVPDLTQAFNEVVANRESVKEAVNEALTR